MAQQKKSSVKTKYQTSAARKKLPGIPQKQRIREALHTLLTTDKMKVEIPLDSTDMNDVNLKPLIAANWKMNNPVDTKKPQKAIYI